MTKTKLAIILGLMLILCVVPYVHAAGNKLSIESVKATVDGKSDSGTLDVKPGSSIKLKIKVQNDYTNAEDIEITDVAATATIVGIDDGDDIEEESDSYDLDADDTKTLTVELQVPEDVDADTYDLNIVIEGDDDANSSLTHTDTEVLSVRVKKESHDVQIKRAELGNPTLSCSRTTSLDVSLKNMGTNDEDGTLKIISNDLEISKQVSFELSEDPFDEDSSFSQSFPISVPNDMEAGAYQITVRADYGSKSVEKVVELQVSDCQKKTPVVQPVTPVKPVEEPEAEEEEVVVTKQPATPEVTVPTTVVTAQPAAQPEEKSSIFSGTGLIALIIGADLLIIIIGVALIVGLARRK